MGCSPFLIQVTLARFHTRSIGNFQVFGINHSRRALCLGSRCGVINRYSYCQVLGSNFVGSATVIKTSAKVTTHRFANRLNFHNYDCIHH